MSAKLPRIKSDLNRVDAHVIQPDEYEEIPELSEESLASADVYQGGTLIRRGRPRAPVTKEQIALRLDRDVVAAFRARGPGWQTRMNAALREWLKNHPAS